MNDRPTELRKWLARSATERITHDLKEWVDGTPKELQEWTATLAKRGDHRELLMEIGWPEDRSALPGDLVVVEVLTSVDALCGSESLGMVLRSTKSGFAYYQTCYGCAEVHKLASSRELLAEEQIIQLLEKRKWLDSDVTLDELEENLETPVEKWITGGKFPVLVIDSIYPGVPRAFKKWVAAYCKKRWASSAGDEEEEKVE